MSISNLLLQYGDRYIQALLTTWKLTAFSFAAAFALGVFITVLRVCPIRPLRSAGDFYVQIFRNIPGVALLILLVYALPYLKILFSYGACVLIATSLIPSAFCSEHLMSGMNTIAPGQIEAARALGLTFFQIIRRIVIPQAMLTTSLASQVPLRPMELTGLVSYINTRAAGGVAAFAISAALYCATALLIGLAGSLIDKKVRILR